MKMLGMLLGVSSIGLLAGCFSSSSSSATYKIDYSDQISANGVSNSKLNIDVNKANLMASVSQAKDETYSIEITKNPNILVHNNCTNIAIGNACQLELSLKASASNQETLNWKVVLPSGSSKSEHTVINKHDLSINLTKSSVLPLNHVDTVTIVNGSKTDYYFNQPIFVDVLNRPLKTAVISNNTCKNEIKLGEQCSFNIQSNIDGAQGYLKLDLKDEPIGEISFSKVVVKGVKNQDIPANAAKGVRYPFTYTFSNTNTTLPATGVSFTNAFPAPDFTLDTANSSCNGITTIAANSSCTWKGTFTPGTNGNKTMSSTLHYAEGSDVSLTSASQVTTIAITGTKNQDIPANAAKGVRYPFTYTFSNTNTTLPATGVSFTNAFPAPDFTLDTANSSCNGITTIAANSSCTWKGTFTPGTIGNKTMSSTLHYAEGSADVSLTSASQVTTIAITGTKNQDIPANAAKGVRYPFTYTFSNTNTTLPATGVSFTNAFPAPDFTLDTANSSCNGITTIAANSSCTWKGTFTPGTNGNKTMSSTLHYAEGSDVSLTSASQVTTIAITGTKNQDIPANAAKGVRYPFTYTFSNTNTTLPATGVSFTNAFPAPDFTLDTANSSCNGITTIAANSSCTWKGTFTPGTNGNKTMSSTLHYAEGSDVSLTSASQVTTIAITGTKNQDIPANAAKGVRYPFTYTFSNTNTTLPATGVSFTNAFPAPDFTLDAANSSCNGITTIAANSSCTWKGTFTPGTNGNKTMSSTLHYAEGSDVSLTSASQVTTIAITGTKNQDIPANAAKGVRYPFTYTFSNTNTTLPATGVSFTNAFPAPDFTLDTANSSCNGITTIAANSSCTWKGLLRQGLMAIRQ